jgi:Uncharacterized protein conserved in bacteria (DUF2059)
MKKIFLFLVFSLCVTNASADVKPIKDTTQNRIAEANRYLSVMPPKDMLIDMVQKMSIQIPVEKRQLFTDLMTKHLDLSKFTSIVRDSMVKNFTAEELQALANFYGSPIGRSAMKKFGQYMADAMPHIQSLMIDAFQKAKAEMENK